MKNLQTIPGVSERSALTILAEIGPDVNAFPSAKHLVSWCSFNPRNDESNKKIKSNKITHGNRFIRIASIQCAWAASRTKECYFSKFYAFHTQVRKKFKFENSGCSGQKGACVHLAHSEIQCFIQGL